MVTYLLRVMVTITILWCQLRTISKFLIKMAQIIRDSKSNISIQGPRLQSSQSEVLKQHLPKQREVKTPSQQKFMEGLQPALGNHCPQSTENVRACPIVRLSFQLGIP